MSFNYLFKAAINNKLDEFVTFRQQHPDQHWLGLRMPKIHSTVLHLAAQHGHLALVHHLIADYQPPCDVNIGDAASKTPLHEAAQSHRAAICKHLMQHGGDPGALKRADWTPLMLACAQPGDALPTIEALLANGNHSTLLPLRNKDGWTALLLAVRAGHLNVVRLFLRHDRALLRIPSRIGRTPLHVACLHGHRDIIRLLLTEYRNCVDITAVDNCGQSCFHDAVLGGDLAVCAMIVDAGACEWWRGVTTMGLNALHLAAGAGRPAIVEYLVRVLHFAPNERSGAAGGERVTPLHCAARGKHGDVMALLVRLGGDMHVTDNRGRTPQDYFPKT